MPVPKKIQEAPELHLGLELYYQGFLALNSSRSQGWGPGPITWVAIRSYCEYLGLDEEQVHGMHFHLANMDNTWLAYQAKKQAQQDKKRKT